MPKAGAAPKVKAARERARQGREGRGEDARASGTAAPARRRPPGRRSSEASAGIGRAEATLAQAPDAAAAATASLTATKDQLVGWLGEEGDPRSLFEAREAELTAAEQAVGDARARRSRRRGRVSTRPRSSPRARRGAIATLANRLSGAWGRLEEDRDVAAEPDAVESAFTAIREELVTRHERATAERDVATSRVEDATRARVGDPARASTSMPDDDFRRALAEAGVAHGADGARVAELEERIAAASELERKVLELEARRGIAKRLADDLQPSRFLDFLLEEERAELAELGSDHFSQLTDGALSLHRRRPVRHRGPERREHEAEGRLASPAERRSWRRWRWRSPSPRWSRAAADAWTPSSSTRDSAASTPSTSTGRWTASDGWFRGRSSAGGPRQPCGRDARGDRGPDRARQARRHRRHDRAVRRRTRCVEASRGVRRRGRPNYPGRGTSKDLPDSDHIPPVADYGLPLGGPIEP